MMGKTRRQPAADMPTPRYDDPELGKKLKAARERAQEKERTDEEKTELAADLARELIKGRGRGRVSSTDMAEASVAAFRGVQGIAARLRIEYEHAPRGSKQRTDILKILKDMVQDLKESQEVTSVSSLTDDEIKREILDLINGSQRKDAGSPKTEDGKLLLEATLMGEGADEFASLEAEIAQLDESHEIDKIAADMLNDADNRAMLDKGVTGAIVPPEDAEDEPEDFDSVEYVE